jgi:type I restriction enzyme, S subunit
MDKMQKVNLSQLGNTITGKTPSSSCPEDFGFEYMFVTPSDSFDNKILCSTVRYLSETGKEKLYSKLLPPKSILITCIGSAMGKVALNKSDCVTNQQINSIAVNNSYDSDYLYYIFKNNYDLLRNASSGSTALPILNKTDFDKLELLVHENI